MQNFGKIRSTVFVKVCSRRPTRMIRRTHYANSPRQNQWASIICGFAGWWRPLLSHSATLKQLQCTQKFRSSFSALSDDQTKFKLEYRRCKWSRFFSDTICCIRNLCKISQDLFIWNSIGMKKSFFTRWFIHDFPNIWYSNESHQKYCSRTRFGLWFLPRLSCQSHYSPSHRVFVNYIFL